MNWLDLLWWVLIAFLVVVAADFIRLWVMREIWKRRHARMVEQVRQRASEQTVIHGLDHK